MASLREDIRRYESEKKVKVKGPIWPHHRCLWCPCSFFGCGRAKKVIAKQP